MVVHDRDKWHALALGGSPLTPPRAGVPCIGGKPTPDLSPGYAVVERANLRRLAMRWSDFSGQVPSCRPGRCADGQGRPRNGALPGPVPDSAGATYRRSYRSPACAWRCPCWFHRPHRPTRSGTAGRSKGGSARELEMPWSC